MRDIDFYVIFAAENSNKFQKNQVLEGKTSWGCGNTWRLTIQFKHDSFHIWLLKKSIHTLQNNFHKLSFPILEWVHTWANCTGHTAQATLMDMKRQISMCLFISMLFIIIKMQFDIDINNDELLTIIWEHCKKESLSLVVCSNVEPKS